MYLVAVALCAAMSGLVDISGARPDASGAQSCMGRDGQPTGNCGDCTVKGDPHIWTYDPHNIINPPSSPPPYNGKNPVTFYTVPGGLEFDDEYAISQLGSVYDPFFGVSAHFKQCGPVVIWGNASCVSSVTYTEPYMDVELILPPNIDTLLSRKGVSPPVWYCQKNYPPGYGDPPTANDPSCATKIKVHGRERVIPDDGLVYSIPGTPGIVEIFQVGPCNSYKCHLVVVGSKGITVSLLVDPGLTSKGYWHDYLYYLNVYATPSLYGQLFGLCDTFTGTATDHYTLRSGSLMKIWSEANIHQFIESWKIGACKCAYRDDIIIRDSGCIITEAAPVDTACECDQTSARYSTALGHRGTCVGTVVNCKDPSLTACTDPNTGYDSCLQGQGDCEGYVDVLYPDE